MTASCVSCGVVDDYLYEVGKKKRGHSSKTYLCPYCYDDYIKGYFVVAYCESCSIEFITPDDDAPFMCKTCRAFNPDLTPDRAYEKAYEDYETSGYLPQTPVVTKKPSMCVRSALHGYVSARKDEGSQIIRERATTWFKIIKGRPDNALVIGEISKLSKEQGITPWKFMEVLAAYDRTEEGVDELIAISKENGYLAYDALDNDKMEVNLGLPPKFFDAYLKHVTVTFCLEKDDKNSPVPF